MRVYSCNPCKDQGKTFEVPADQVGAALMVQHLHDEHQIETPDLGLDPREDPK